MGSLWFHSALAFTLLASGGFIAYIVRQRRWIFRISFWLLSAGFVLHTVFLVHRYALLETAPVLTLKAALSFFAWTITAAYLLLQAKFRLMVLGSFAAPFATFLMIVSSAMPWTEAPVKPVFKSLWLTIHVGTIFMGNGLFAIAFLVAIMYLIQERHIKQKRLRGLFTRLPSLATLDAVNHHALLYGFPLLTVGMITGSVYAQVALGSYWQWDPKEVWSLITWLFYAALVHERVAAGWRGRKAALLSIACFAILLFTFIGASLWLGGYHSFDNLGSRSNP